MWMFVAQKETSREEGAEVCCPASSTTAGRIRRTSLCHCSGRKCASSLSFGGVDKVTECLLTLSLAALGRLKSLWETGTIHDRQEQELRIHQCNEAALCLIQKHLSSQLPLSKHIFTVLVQSANCSCIWSRHQLKVEVYVSL